jgi:hypothetical protein
MIAGKIGKILHASIDNTRPLKHNVFMNRLGTEERTQIIAALCEGMSIRGIERMLGFTNALSRSCWWMQG